MIGRLSGLLAAKNPPRILIDVGGVGYEADVPMSTFYNLPASGEKVTLLIHHAIREDGQFLYAFGTEEERTVFRQLLKISGIGARIALALLSGISIAELHAAVARQESARLTKVPGIGKKTAERLLLELKGKLPAPTGGAPLAGAEAGGEAANDILNALLALGYSEKEATLAWQNLPPGLPTSEGIRQALKTLARL
ncbi:MAG: Holliday junction branch migration protein RuvA [Zoogloeaceae bacterium]|jgi:Holliday junction DNA helicase RuvA|nr:Holliday junction branch migration protein RuvA [Zoogloeaceae bacterium]